MPALLHRAFLLVGLIVAALAGSAAPAHTPGAPAAGLPPPIQLERAYDFYRSVKPDALYLRDPAPVLSPVEVFAAGERFAPIAAPYISFGVTRATIWLRFSATNPTPRPATWRIDFARHYLTHLTLYEKRAGEPLRPVFRHRQGEDFARRDIPSRNLMTDVHFEAGETVEFLVSYSSAQTTFLPMAIGTPDAVMAIERRGMALDLATNGALIAMVAFSLLLLPVLGRSLSLAFATYIVAGIAYVLIADGYALRWLWPGAQWLNERMNLAAILLLSAAAVNFGRQLFHFDTFAPRFNRFLRAWFVVALAGAALGFALIELRAVAVGAYFIAPVTAVVMIVSALVALRNGSFGAWPYLVGTAAVSTAFGYATVAHVVPDRFDLDFTLDYGHFTLFVECLAFSVAILLRLIALRDQRDAALQAELALSREKLRLSEELLQSREDYDQARQLSLHRLQRLSELSHDLRQPLAALRSTLGRARWEGEESAEQINQAFDYLEGLARSPGPAVVEETRNGRASETFAVQVVLANVAHIFSDEARAKGMRLRCRETALRVRCNPVALMRVVSNLVANAVHHSGAEDVLIAARTRGAEVRIEVRDNGIGMEEPALARALLPSGKGKDSTGEGLGLAIVQQVCAEMSLRFEIRSRPGSGTCAFLSAPRA